MSESKEMKMLKELLRDTVYGKEWDILAFMANNTCEALGHLREWIDDLKQQRDDLLDALEKYGDHEPCCVKGDACNCGFEAAIKKAQ